MEHGVVGLERLELSTSRLSGVRSNRLSYKPRFMSKCTSEGALHRESLLSLVKDPDDV